MPPPTKDIFLQSITQNGRTAFLVEDDFIYVSNAVIRRNTAITASSIGGASTDRGDNASNPLGLAPKQDLRVGNAADGAAVAAYLGNNNLNNIIDTEDTGFFTLDLTFAQPVANNDRLDSFFFWERGLNSDIQVQALNAAGELIGNAVTINRNLWTDAGYKINTTEIDNDQEVGSFGVSFRDLGLGNRGSISTIRVISERNFRGPDFKVIAATGFSEPIPEPTTIIGLGSVAALALVRRRQTKKTSSL